jgi:hypothetical protein
MAPPEEPKNDFLNRVVGTMEAREMFEAFSGAYHSVTTSVSTTRPDLSLQIK